MARLLAQLRALGWHVDVHRAAGDLMHLPAAARCRLPIVVDHFGRPDGTAVGAMQDLMRCCGPPPRAPLGQAVSGLPQLARLEDPPASAAAQALLSALGPQRLLWGSDWPHTQHRELADFA